MLTEHVLPLLMDLLNMEMIVSEILWEILEEILKQDLEEKNLQLL